jgi:uncharacterized membrane protein (TIGR02234 family)
VRRLGPFVLALVLDLVGAGGVLLVSVRHWQTISTPQPARVDVLGVTGRTVDSASTALGLVAMAGVVAVLATRGLARRVIGVVLLLAGAGLVWRAITSAGAVGTSRARSIVQDKHRTVDASSVVPHVVTHSLWPVLSGIGGVLVLLAGLLITWRGHRWQVMSARYERPEAEVESSAPTQDVDEEQQRAKAAITLWSALDRGEDPTR